MCFWSFELSVCFPAAEPRSIDRPHNVRLLLTARAIEAAGSLRFYEKG